MQLTNASQLDSATTGFNEMTRNFGNCFVNGWVEQKTSGNSRVDMAQQLTTGNLVNNHAFPAALHIHTILYSLTRIKLRPCYGRGL